MKATDWQYNLQQIQQARLFHNVPQANLSELLTEFQAYSLEPGEELLSPFKRNEHLYLLLEGALQVFLDLPDHQAIHTLQPGEFVGEISFIDNALPSAYVVARDQATVLRLHRKSLHRLSSQCPAFMQNLLELLCARIREGNRTLADSEQNAHLDSLTGCFNRRWMDYMFERESNRCQFNNEPLCLLILDVDHFKAYNDQHGHLAGDYALCLVANTLLKQLRPRDSMARYGGEEFVIILPQAGLDDAEMVAERLRQSLERISSFYSPIGELPGVTASLGLAQLQPDESLQELIARADSALYQAKDQGRNRVCR